MALSLRRAMAGRRYVRDNRGRFATVGATARGGRLATASGNKRATQTTKLSGDKASGTIGKPKGLKPGAIKAKPQVSSERQAATDRLKVKTQTRRAMSADRGSVVTPGQSSRLETGRGSTRAGARPASTVAKPRTTGNTKQQVASRVERKLAATNANLSDMTRYGRGANPTVYNRQLKRSVTLQRAQSYLTTGKLPGRDNSMAFKRNTKEATTRINAKRAARKRAAASQQSLTQRRQTRAAANFTRTATAKPLPGNRRLTKSQVRSQLRTESAMTIYKGGTAGAKEIRNARGLARTSKAKNNQLQTRAQRLENAQRSGNPLVTVSGLAKRRRKSR